MSGTSPDDPVIVDASQIVVSVNSHVMMRQISKVLDTLVRAREIIDNLNGESHIDNCLVCSGVMDPHTASFALMFFTVHQMYWPGHMRNAGGISENMPPTKDWVGKPCRVCQHDHTMIDEEIEDDGLLDIDEDIVCFPRCGHVVHFQCVLLHFYDYTEDPNMTLPIPVCPVCGVHFFEPEPEIQLNPRST